MSDDELYNPDRVDLRYADNSRLLADIEKNPWNEKIFHYLSEKATKERFKGPEYKEDYPDFYETVDAQALVELVEGIRNAGSLEEKYKLLAQEAIYSRDYLSWRKRARWSPSNPEPISWYEVVQGRPYKVHPPRDQYESFQDHPHSILSALNETIGLDNWGNAVDIGSGTGNSLDAFGEHAERVVAVDRYAFLHHVARETNRDIEVDYITADASDRLPIKSDSVDLVVSNGLLAFIPSEKLDLFAEEVSRILSEGGSFFEPMSTGELTESITNEYSQNARALLAFMAGELIVAPEPGKSGKYPHEFSDTYEAFQRRGLIPIIHRYKHGAVVLEYFKVPGELEEKILENYRSGNTKAARDSIEKLLNDDEMPLSKRLRIIGKLARISSSDAIDIVQFIEVYLSPLLKYAFENKQLTPAEEMIMKNVYGRNLMRIDRESISNKDHEAIKELYESVNSLEGWGQQAYHTKYRIRYALEG